KGDKVTAREGRDRRRASIGARQFRKRKLSGPPTGKTARVAHDRGGTVAIRKELSLEKVAGNKRDWRARYRRCLIRLHYHQVCSRRLDRRRSDSFVGDSVLARSSTLHQCCAATHDGRASRPASRSSRGDRPDFRYPPWGGQSASLRESNRPRSRHRPVHKSREEATQKLRTKWSEWGKGVELVVI